MVSKHNIRLNPNRNKAVHTGFAFASGDKGITLVIEVEEMDCSNTTAKIVFKRSNGTSVEADITGSNNVYTYELRGNELEIPGLVVADVKFYEDTKRISTATFTFTVSSDTMDGLGAGTGGYSDRLEQLVEEAEIVVAEAEKIYNDATNTANAAKDTLNNTTAEAVQTEAELKAMLVQYQNKFGEVGVLNPSGTYNSATTYEKFDLVYYGGVSWLCLQRCTGVTPVEGACWQLFASADGGDAAKLGGKGASEYALGTDIAKINLGAVSILESEVGTIPKTYGIPDMYTYIASISPQAPTDGVLLFGGYMWTLIGMTYGNYNYGYQIGFSANGQIKFRRVYDGVWENWTAITKESDLANYLPKSGGTIDGGDNAVPLILNRTMGDYVEIGFQGPSGNLGYLGMSGVDSPVFENSARNAAYSLLHTGNSAKVAIQSTAPSDTTTLWYDTVNKACKRYVDGAWQA